MSENIVQDAIQAAQGPTRVARAFTEAGQPITRQAVEKWVENGCLPRTEWTGETKYAEILEQLTGGEFTKEALLSCRSSAA